MFCGVVDPKPVVNCSFVTEFEDHIFVAMDAEAVLFIHDLVINYVKEKDQGITFLFLSPASDVSYYSVFLVLAVSKMTYTVSSGTLNPGIPYHTIFWFWWDVKP